MIHCAPNKTESAPEAQAASVCIVGMPCNFSSISGMNAPRWSCLVNCPALKFPTAAASISAGSIFASAMRFLARFDDDVAKGFAFFSQVALKVGPARAEDVNRFHSCVKINHG